ncbi:hypothetical protein LT493_22385 [Streptomyces tricolor]|nr:hypothetical protein [Streptomyces tricolor]
MVPCSWPPASVAPELSDAELLSAAGEGAAQAMRALEERHGAAVRAYARTCVVSADDAAELTAYAFTGLRLRAARTPPRRGGMCARRPVRQRPQHRRAVGQAGTAGAHTVVRDMGRVGSGVVPGRGR